MSEQRPVELGYLFPALQELRRAAEKEGIEITSVRVSGGDMQRLLDAAEARMRFFPPDMATGKLNPSLSIMGVWVKPEDDDE